MKYANLPLFVGSLTLFGFHVRIWLVNVEQNELGAVVSHVESHSKKIWREGMQERNSEWAHPAPSHCWWNPTWLNHHLTFSFLTSWNVTSYKNELHSPKCTLHASGQTPSAIHRTLGCLRQTAANCPERWVRSHVTSSALASAFSCRRLLRQRMFSEEKRRHMNCHFLNKFKCKEKQMKNRKRVEQHNIFSGATVTGPLCE